MANKEPHKWRRLPKVNLSSRDLSRRFRKVEGATVKHARRFVFRRLDNFKEVRRRIAIWVIAIGIIIGAVGLQHMWYQQSYRTAAFAEEGTYAEGVMGPLDTLNPIFASTSAEEAAGELIFSRLLSYDSTGHLSYDLVNNMTVGNGGKTYTLTIRPDARWQDGPYVRARDVVFTVNLIKNPATRSTITGWSDVKVTAVDDRTVQFDLPVAYAAFPHALRMLPILPEHLLRDIEPSAVREYSFSRKPIGSGPFEIRFIQDVDVANGRKIVHLAKSDDYFKGAPRLDRFQLHVYKDGDALRRALATAEVNAATDLSITGTDSVNNERYDVEYRPTNSGVYAILNTVSPLLQDIKIRQALQAGTNTAALREALGDRAPSLYLPFVNGQIFGDVPGAPAYDVSKAARLLDEAGWRVAEGSTTRSKDGQALRLSVVTTKNTDFEAVLAVLASQWRDLGVTITTRIVNPSDPSQNVVKDVLQPRNFDVLLYQLTIGGDPDVYAYWHSSQASGGFNFSNYRSSTSDDALVSARSRVEPDLRNAKYLTFARQWLNDVPAIGLYQATMQYVSTKSVHTIPKDFVLISPIDRFDSVLYWSVGERMVYKTP